MSSLGSVGMASEHRIVARNTKQQRTLEEFGSASSLHPLVVGHMCKQDKTGHSFSKRYFALYSGGLLAYYTHQRDYEGDVKKNKGLPLHCTLIKLDGVYLTRSETVYRRIHHCFTLHAPDSSNHRLEFVLVCQSHKDMRIWVEQLQSHNTNLSRGDGPRKTPCYIQKMRLQSFDAVTGPAPVEELQRHWLTKATYHPGEIALLMFRSSSPTNSSTDSDSDHELEPHEV